MSAEKRYWDQKFSRPEFVYGRRPNRFLVEQAPRLLSSHADVLSLGEGEGRNAVWLARQRFNVTAVDHSRAALKKLQSLAAQHRVQIDAVLSDVVDFDCGASRWDAVVLLHVHLSPERRERLHHHMVEALRPGGILLLEALRLDQLHRRSSGPADQDLLYSEEILRRDFSELHIRHLREEDRHISAGEHQGLTSVVSMVAEKTST